MFHLNLGKYFETPSNKVDSWLVGQGGRAHKVVELLDLSGKPDGLADPDQAEISSSPRALAAPTRKALALLPDNFG